MGRYQHWLEPWQPPEGAQLQFVPIAQQLDEFDPPQREWLRRRVDLECPNMLTMTPEELRQRQRLMRYEKGVLTTNDAAIVLTFIFQWFLRWRRGGQPVRGNLRSFWYGFVSLHLERLGLLERPPGGPVDGPMPSRLTGRRRYLLKSMEDAFEELFRHRFMRYRDIEVYDNRRLFRIIGRTKRRFVLYIEKEGLFWFLQEMAELHQCTALASRGAPGWVDLDYLVADLEAKNVRNLFVATLTDYDPWGEFIGISFGEKLLNHPTWKFKSVEVAAMTTLDLYDPDDVPVIKRYLLRNHEDPEDPVHKLVMDWVARGGGIDGEPYGLYINNVEWHLVRNRVARWIRGTWPVGPRKILLAK